MKAKNAIKEGRKAIIRGEEAIREGKEALEKIKHPFRYMLKKLIAKIMA